MKYQGIVQFLADIDKFLFFFLFFLESVRFRGLINSISWE